MPENPKPDGRQTAERRAQRASLVGVAEAVGVSPSSVSNAYNRPDQLSAELRERILRTAAELGYPGPDPTARNLRRGRSGSLAMVFPERLPYPFTDPYAMLVLRGVAEGLAEAQQALMLVPGSPDQEADEGAVRNAAVDGFIVHSLLEENALFQVALARQLPIVVVDGPQVRGLDCITINDRAGTRAAAAHLLELGHQRIGVLTTRLTGHTNTGPVPPDERHLAVGIARQRLEGCAEAVLAAGLSWDDTVVMECSMTSVEAGHAGMRALLDTDPQVTGVVAFSDLIAVGARQAAAERGLMVPFDISIVGFDDVAQFENLTTIRQPAAEKGRLAVERLIELLSGAPQVPKHQVLPTELIVRGSTAPPPVLSRAAAR